MTRTSRQQVKKVLDLISTADKRYELIILDHLGEAQSVWYTYSIIEKSEPSYEGVDFATGEKVTRSYVTGYKRIERVIYNVSLKEAYAKAIELMRGK